MLIPYSKSNPRTYTSVSTRSYQVNEGPVTTDVRSTSTFGYSDTFHGFKQPGWRQIIRNGGNATTNAQGTRETFQDSGISALCEGDFGAQKVTRYAVGSVSAFTGRNYFLPIDGSIPTSEIDNRALVGFLRKAKAAQRKLAVGVVAGELRETINLIRNPAVGLRNLVSDYVGSCRGLSRGASPRTTLRHISNQWLEFSFGARPLIADIQGALKSVEKRMFDLPSAYVTHEYKEPSNAHNDTIPFDLYSGAVPCLLARLTYRVYGRKLSGGVRLMTTGSYGPIAETIGLTLPDFIPTVYELIPYSFLVDYFTNIGEVLDALSFNQADLIWHSDVRFERAVRTVTVIPARPATVFGVPVIDYSCGTGAFSERFESFSRVSVPLGVPSLGFKVPDTWTKALNIGALASLRALR